MLAERLATITTRLNRFQSVEDTLFALARDKAGSFDNVINSSGLKDEPKSDPVTIMLGIMGPLDDYNAELYYEINCIKDLHNISGYGYVLEHRPELRKALFRDRGEENLDIYELIGGRATHRKQSRGPHVRIEHVAPDGSRFEETPKEKTDDALDESGLKVSAADIAAYIGEQHDKLKRRISVTNFIQECKRRTQLLADSAMPDSNELDRLMRYQTSLDRQLSKALGELLHVIDRRKTTIRKQ